MSYDSILCDFEDQDNNSPGEDHVPSGFLLISRRLSRWRWKRNPDMIAIWIELMLRAQFRDSEVGSIKLKRGQCLVSYPSLSRDTGVTLKSTRVCISRLKRTGEIAHEAAAKYSIITIVNYDKYQEMGNYLGQGNKQPLGQAEGRQGAGKGQARGRQGAAYKELKERKELKEGEGIDNLLPSPVVVPKLTKFNPEGKTKYMDWVYLSPEQFQRVKAYYTEKGLGPDDLKEAIRELDRWFDNNRGMRSKRSDDAKALMGWPLDNALTRRNKLAVTKQIEDRR